MFVDMNTFRKTNRKTFVHQVGEGSLLVMVEGVHKSLPEESEPVVRMLYANVWQGAKPTLADVEVETQCCLSCGAEESRRKKSRNFVGPVHGPVRAIARTGSHSKVM